MLMMPVMADKETIGKVHYADVYNNLRSEQRRKLSLTSSVVMFVNYLLIRLKLISINMSLDSNEYSFHVQEEISLRAN